MATQILGKEGTDTLRSTQPAYRLREVDQTAPAGMWRMAGDAGDMVFQASADATWSSFTDVVTLTSAPSVTIHGTIAFSGTVVFSADIRLDDDIVALFGDGSDFYMGYSATAGTLQVGVGSTINSAVAFSVDTAGDLDLNNNDLFNVGAAGNDWSTASFTHDGSALFNAGNGNYDFRIESQNNADVFKMDASRDAVGIGMAPDAGAGIFLAGGLTHTSGTNVASVLVYPLPALTIDGYDAQRAGAVDIYEPGPTLENGGTVIHAYTLRVRGPAYGTNKYALWVDDGMALFDEGVNVGGTSTNNKIDDASGGSGSSTLYIGNESITTSSDARLKTNIRPTEIDALALLDQMDVVDFGWDDPSDVTEYGKNYRGTYTGMVAQDTVKLVPWVINDQGGGRDCKSCMAGEDCDLHGMFQVKYQELVPLLIKAIQELADRAVD